MSWLRSGNIRYSLNAEGLIQSQVDEWNITRFDAIRQTFTPRLWMDKKRNMQDVGDSSGAAGQAEVELRWLFL